MKTIKKKRESNNPFFLKLNPIPHKHYCICGEESDDCTIPDCMYPIVGQGCNYCFDGEEICNDE